MRKTARIIFVLCLMILLAGCGAVTPIANSESEFGTLSAATEEKAVAPEKVVIYAPASTSSVPVILAAAKMQNVELVLYTNQAQANTVFLRGDAQILVTGLSVGLDLHKNQAPITLVNTYVTGLSYLVTSGITVTTWADLIGQQVYVPFEGSPIEEVAAYLVRQEGLAWKKDIAPVYSPFDASIALLKEGKAAAVILPEPMVSLLEGQPGISVSLDLYDEWNRNNPAAQGYPQVGSFANSQWAADHHDIVDQFSIYLSGSIEQVQGDPESAVDAVIEHFKIPAPIMVSALGRTRYQLLTGEAMKNSVQMYYQVIGKELDETTEGFFYSAAN